MTMNNQIQHKDSTKVPEPTLRRLPWYLSNVKLLKQKGERYVSSTQISKEINIDASQIAKDLSYVNISGRTRVGYEVDALIAVLEDFLGFTNCTRLSFSVWVVWEERCYVTPVLAISVWRLWQLLM